MSSTQKMPPGESWFETHKKDFENVPVRPEDKGIETSAFLEASEATTTLFGTTSLSKGSSGGTIRLLTTITTPQIY